MAYTIGGWNSLPQTATGGLATIPNRVRNHLPRATAQSNPNPSLIRLFRDKGPEFIQFQDRRIRMGGIRDDYRFAQGWELCGLFFSHAITEFRETPKVRSSPRKLLRSS